MERILKVLATDNDQDIAIAAGQLIERYDAFVVLRADEQAATQLSQRFPVEDITSLYRIQAEGEAIDTDVPRITSAAATRAHPAYRGAAARKLPAGSHHYLIQFVGPVKDAWLAALRKTKAQVRAPYADFTVVVRANEAQLAKIVGLPFVRWSGHLPWGRRVSRDIDYGESRPQRERLPRTVTLEGVYGVQFFDAGDLRRAKAAVQRLGFKILSKPTPGSTLLVVSTDGTPQQRQARIAKLSAVHGVRFVESQALPRTTNDVARDILGVPPLQPAVGSSLTGANEIVAVCDTGLDTGDPLTVHEDFRGRVAGIKSYAIAPLYATFVNNPGADDGPADVDSGHGTHVAGSVLGNGTVGAAIPGFPRVLGSAPGARLYFQAIEQDMKWKSAAHFVNPGRYILSGIPGDMTVLLQDAYAAGARIHSNSWGGGDPGAYSAKCQQLDKFVWEHPDLVVVIAAGNDGADRNSDGRIDAKSVTAPGTAKNCITVGASENVRPGFNGQTYGGWWPQDFPVAPPKTDPMADSRDHVAAFSSRGPTSDGRNKPDVVAPGTFILSARSSMIAANNFAWAKHPSTSRYFHMGGTSMAAPLVSGCCALLRQHLQRDVGLAAPSAALVKAALICGARRFGPASSAQVVDNEQGYGRVDLPRIVKPSAPAKATYHDIAPGLRTGEQTSVTINVASSAVPLRVVLCYSDYPGSTLVNNLNLMLRDPAGAIRVGNQAPGGPMAPDTKNNVEVVEVASPQIGAWAVSVVGSNVPKGPQPYALAILAS